MASLSFSLLLAFLLCAPLVNGGLLNRFELALNSIDDYPEQKIFAPEAKGDAISQAAVENLLENVMRWKAMKKNAPYDA
uniref:Uncharacterized protein n=1 Tax=Plectus sambesii TaxID=2011161 RepID=A0A914UMK9_9BILA